ncbi:hypothetical protein KUTeg_006891 [Tegillarca granosa]|uniref:GATOR2 complex protein WDR24 n=1 Tax=Tegillarca granosa TaxID=220873 RepID=A0ABQ9FEU8_TEGGR|nr:hypothetical protein KUTeg_006891 [Tegillarca granosa]
MASCHSDRMSVMQNVTKAMDRVSSQGPSRTMGHSCEGPINSMDLNKDASHAVVAGRNGIYSLLNVRTMTRESKHQSGEKLKLKLLLRQTWPGNHSDDHKRTVNRVRFHEHEPYLLLSGSQDGSMKLFDMRSKTLNTTFSTGTTSIRDVQFCPARDSYFTFASADEGGNIQIWDLRRPDRFEKQFTAHSGPVFCIDWHPEERHWFATAGRDKIIKVWDLSKVKSETLYQIHNIAPVARIRWRPQRKYQIASCSLIIDCSVNIWDLRRPYVPFAAFIEHRDVTTGIVWRKEDPHIFYSVSKDSFLYQHVFKDAIRPADKLIPSGLSMNLLGDVSYASENKLETAHAKNTSHYTLNVFRKKPDRTNRFTTDCSSNMFVLNNISEALSMTWFVDCARRYLLHGHPFVDICEHNARVAEDYERYEVSQSWRILKDLFHEASTSIYTSSIKHHPRTTSIMSTVSEKQEGEKKGNQNDKLTNNQENENPAGDITSGHSDEESDRDISEKNLSNIARGQIIDPVEEWEIFFGDGDKFSYEMNAIENNQTEAFQPRHDIKDHHSDNPLEAMQNGQDSPTYSANDSESNPPKMLHRFQLWSKANEIIKLSHLPQISMMNQQSTVIHINCNSCSRPLQRVGWLCDRCKLVTNRCSICHLPVKGRFVWCQGCSHGGHLDHIREWLAVHKRCPAGCGHICEYT